MNELQFKEELLKIGVDLSSEQSTLIDKYLYFLLEYNKNVNLTALRNKEDAYLKHFYDSLLLLKFKRFTNEKILDIGSGAGFPGVPLKIVFPDIDLTVLDSNGKKTKFLEELKDHLGLDYTVINERAEKYVLSKRESFDVVMGRAVTQMPILAELCIPFVKEEGVFISYKGNLDETLENGIYAIETLGAEVEDVFTANLPFENSTRNFVISRKKCQTDEEYPRTFEKINKKPLQK